MSTTPRGGWGCGLRVFVRCCRRAFGQGKEGGVVVVHGVSTCESTEFSTAVSGQQALDGGGEAGVGGVVGPDGQQAGGFLGDATEAVDEGGVVAADAAPVFEGVGVALRGPCAWPRSTWRAHRLDCWRRRALLSRGGAALAGQSPPLSQVRPALAAGQPAPWGDGSGGLSWCQAVARARGGRRGRPPPGGGRGCQAAPPVTAFRSRRSCAWSV